MGRSLHATWLGRVSYVDAWRMQEAVATRVRDGGDERLLLLEHDPVYTIGRRGTTDHLLAGPEELRAVGASVYRVDRGGDITYHGPGQLVGYPITSFAEGADLVGYVRAIEEAVRDALAVYGVASRTERGKTGVWVDLPDGRPAKIAAIGVRVSRGVTTHGFALNVSTDLAAFERVLPCGFQHEVASLERLGVSADVSEVGERCARALASRLGRDLIVGTSVEAPRDAEIPTDAPVRLARNLLAEPVPA
ncbi:MAG: lipoyl(octanoyl) transferase LipB [Chloroflexota bacterium]